MKPPVIILQPGQIGAYLYPDNLPNTPLTDYQLGGVGLSDPTQGLQYQAWTLQVHGSGAATAVYLSSSNTAPTLIFSYPNITWARLAFDQNMHPVISFIASSLPYYYWWDPNIPGNTISSLSSTVINPCVTLDDKRPLSTTLGLSDVVMSYINSGNLCYRLQRDRYNVEYVWMTGINSLISNPFVNKIGMANNLRLLIEVRGALYL